MTIHKSKGLEFEVVIVPELQAGNGRGKPRMLSWLERGPGRARRIWRDYRVSDRALPAQGRRRGKAKEWVDRVYRERESQETRRILYVAATRAREELHLFARSRVQGGKRDFTLVEPVNSLLATAWPALEEEVRRRFEDWKAARAASATQESQEIASIAASGESNLLVMPSPARATLLRRLPLDYQPAPDEALGHPAKDSTVIGLGMGSGIGPRRLYARHEGGLLSRALGTAVHSLLEELARLRRDLDWDAARLALQPFEPALPPRRALSAWTSPWPRGLPRRLASLRSKPLVTPSARGSSHPRRRRQRGRLDRRCGRRSALSARGPRLPGWFSTVRRRDDCWWIIDYKTAHADNMDPAQALPGLRQLFAPRLRPTANCCASCMHRSPHHRRPLLPAHVAAGLVGIIGSVSLAA